MVGRVKLGVSLAALQQKLSAMVRNSFAQTGTFSAGEGKALLSKVHVVLTPGGGGIQNLQENYSSNLRLLMIISALVLLIACANIANLLLDRGMGRRSEICLRAALGAKRSHIIRQFLTESVLLAVLSGIAGLAVAYAGTRMLLALAFSDAENLPIHASPSVAVLAFAFGLSLLTGILSGLAPAWFAAKADPADALRSGTRTTGSGATLLQRGLVVLQAACHSCFWSAPACSRKVSTSSNTPTCTSKPPTAISSTSTRKPRATPPRNCRRSIAPSRIASTPSPA
jgi:hypothetical protein